MPVPRAQLRAVTPSRALFGCSVALLLAACAAGPDPRADPLLAPGVALDVSPGGRVRLPDGDSLTYVGLRSDSRCPPAVVCIHAGWAEIDMILTTTTGRTEFVLSTRAGATGAPAGRSRVELVELGRGSSPVARLRSSPAAR